MLPKLDQVFLMGLIKRKHQLPVPVKKKEAVYSLWLLLITIKTPAHNTESNYLGTLKTQPIQAKGPESKGLMELNYGVMQKTVGEIFIPIQKNQKGGPSVRIEAVLGCPPFFLVFFLTQPCPKANPSFSLHCHSGIRKKQITWIVLSTKEMELFADVMILYV